jgi:sigma-E factor negative regulatory protein RseC
LATETGIITRVEAENAWVKTTKSKSCEGCSSKGSCSTAGNDMIVEALNKADAKIGDLVTLQIESSALYKATFLLYILPIIGLLGGSFLGQYFAEMYGWNLSATAAIFGFALFVLIIAFVRYKGNQMGEKQAYRPKIVRVVKRA